MLSPLYIAEIAPARIRGRLVSLNQFAIIFGMLLVYFVNAYVARAGDRIGGEAGQWARAMMAERGVQCIRVLQGFVGLARKHSAVTINHASRTALHARLFRLRSLRELCKRLADKEDLQFAESHPIIRPLADYQAVLTHNPAERR